MRKYKFFYHYNRQTKKMTIHWKDQCISVKDLFCYAMTWTKWNKRQPYVVMTGFAERITVNRKESIATIV